MQIVICGVLGCSSEGVAPQAGTTQFLAAARNRIFKFANSDSFALAGRVTPGFSVQFAEMDVNFRHKPRVTICNFRYAGQYAAIPHQPAVCASHPLHLTRVPASPL